MQTDLVSIANGSADEVLISNYTINILSYIATDQSVDKDALVSGILASNDVISLDEDTTVEINVLSNDSLDSTGTPVITVSAPTNGTAVVGSGGVITYTPSADFNGTDSFSYTITQGTKSGSASVNITINPVNDSPVINAASTIAVNENTTAVGTISTSDVDTGDSLELTLGGTDASSFELSSANALTFITAPDFETKTSYSLTFSLTDGTLTTTKDITISVTNLNDVAPTISSATSFTIEENELAIGTLTVVDPEGGSFTYTVAGTDGSLINISNSGVLTFKTAPDFETKTSYSFTVTVSDGVNSSTKEFTISITDLPELPTSGYRVPTSIDVIETKE
jgi:serralysin